MEFAQAYEAAKEKSGPRSKDTDYKDGDPVESMRKRGKKPRIVSY